MGRGKQAGYATARQCQAIDSKGYFRIAQHIPPRGIGPLSHTRITGRYLLDIRTLSDIQTLDNAPAGKFSCGYFHPLDILPLIFHRGCFYSMDILPQWLFHVEATFGLWYIYPVLKEPTWNSRNLP